MKEIEELEKEIEKKKERRQKKKKAQMKVSGKGVFELHKILAGKNKK